MCDSLHNRLAWPEIDRRREGYSIQPSTVPKGLCRTPSDLIMRVGEKSTRLDADYVDVSEEKYTQGHKDTKSHLPEQSDYEPVASGTTEQRRRYGPVQRIVRPRVFYHSDAYPDQKCEKQ